MWISKKEIRELSEGIQKTLEGQEFDPRDDKEGPWSILKNDIYTLINLEREQRDIAVEEKEKLSEYLADISHQLKTPISSIQLMAELMTDAPENKKKEFLFSILGCVSVGLGAAGTVLPVLPTVPFLMLGAFCFARSSKKLENWFKNTKLYKNNLADFAAGRGMTKRTKCRIMAVVTLLMSIGFILMGAKGIVAGCIVLGCVWVFHLVYFLFGVKTIPAAKGREV